MLDSVKRAEVSLPSDEKKLKAQSQLNQIGESAAYVVSGKISTFVESTTATQSKIPELAVKDQSLGLPRPRIPGFHFRGSYST